MVLGLRLGLVAVRACYVMRGHLDVVLRWPAVDRKPGDVSEGVIPRRSDLGLSVDCINAVVCCRIAVAWQ